MALADFKRVYGLSDGDLSMFVSNLVTFMNRDIDEFSNFSIDSDDINDLNERGNEFDEFPTDEELLADVGIATENKNESANHLRNSIRSIAVRAENKWSANSARYRKFGIMGMNKFNDRDLLVCGKRVHRVALGYLLDLESEGLTQQILDDLESVINNFEENLNLTEDAISERDIKTEERINKGNELYTYVVKYCNIGKQIWSCVSPAKYNDYLIYSTGTGGSSGGTTKLPAPTNFRYEYAEYTIKWNSVQGATSYQLQYSINNEDWDILFEGDATEFQTADILPDHTFLRIRCRDANGFSDFRNLNIVYNYILIGPANLTYNSGMPGFTWNSVDNAMTYEVEYRESTGTDDDYIRIYYGSNTQVMHSDSPGTHYVRVRAWNNQGLSGWMLLAYIVNA